MKPDLVIGVDSVLSPHWDALASGIIAGWRGTHGPAHLYRAILERIAFEQRLCVAAHWFYPASAARIAAMCAGVEPQNAPI